MNAPLLWSLCAVRHEEMEQESNIEKVAGNLTTDVALSLFATLAGGYLAPLLPVLTSSLASTRHSHRIRNAIVDLNGKLSRMEADIYRLNDSQFKLIGEAVRTLTSTVNDEKIELLKSCIVNTVDAEGIDDSEAVAVARALRDISTKQFKVLEKYRNSERILIYEVEAPENTAGTETWLLTGTDEATAIFELSALGLLAIEASGAGGGLHYRYLSSAHRLLNLCLS